MEEIIQDNNKKKIPERALESSPPPAAVAIDQDEDSPSPPHTPPPQRQRQNVNDSVGHEYLRDSNAGDWSRKRTPEPVRDVCSGLATTHLETPKRPRISNAGTDDSTSTRNDEDNDKEAETSSWQVVPETKSGNKKDQDAMSVDSVISMDFMSDGDGSSLDGADNSSNATFNMSRPFDMKLLKHSIEVGSDALDRVAGRDVVLVVGKTGSGKSTLLQALAGKTLYATNHTTEYNGHVVNQTVFEAKDALPDFEIGHAKKSQTKSIRYLERFISEEKTVLFLDSPGLEDTDGPEMDIATSAMLNQVARTAKSIRFCILIHFASLLEDRGGQIRSILKFTKNFVKDFQKEKQSFVFLFTHSHETQSVDSIGSAREFLLKEVIKILAESKDEDVKAVLDFMRLCLKKGLPLVNVIHPLETDFMELRNTLETKVKKVKNPTVAVNSGLTWASKFKLEGEIKSLTVQLRDLLNRSPTNTKEILEIRDTLLYLEKYIDITEVQNAVKTCVDEIDCFSSEQQKIFEEELQRGIDVDQIFVSSNAQALSDAIRRLVDLKADTPEEYYTGRIQRGVYDHFQTLVLDVEECKDIRTVATKLDKLAAWKEAFPEFQTLYSNVQECYTNLILNYTEMLKKIETQQLEAASEEEIDRLVKHLRFVESVSLQQASLSNHMLEVSAPVQIFDFTKRKLGSLISSWQEDEASMMDTDGYDNDNLMSLISKAKMLDVFQVRLAKDSVCQDLFKCIQGALQDIEDRVVGVYQQIGEELLKQMVPYDEDTLKLLQAMKDASTICQGMRGDKLKEIQLCYSNVLNSVRSLLFAMTRDLDSRSKLVPNGVENGREEGEALKAFDACIPLDDFFEPEDRFVRCCSIRYQRVYHDRIEKLRADITQSFDLLYDPGRNSVSILQSMRDPLMECSQIVELASITGNEEWASLKSHVQNESARYISHLCQIEEQLLPEWEKNAEVGGSSQKDIKLLSSKVNMLLEDLDAFIQHTNPDNPRAANLQSEIARKLQSCSRMIDRRFDGERDYELFADTLRFVEAVGSCWLVSKYLPSLDGLKLKMGSMISEDAKQIEELINNSSNWDEIDSLIVEFEKAKAVDHYIGMDATSRLGTLNKLREKKESDVDNFLEELVAKQDFKGIGEFLSPFAESQDQIKRQKFARHQTVICSSLRSLQAQVERLIDSDASEDNVRIIAQNIEKLRDAEQEIGFHIKASLDLVEIIKKLDRLINDKVDDVADQALFECKRADFLGMASLCDRLDICSRILSVQLYQKTKCRIQSVLNSSKARIDGIARVADKFLSSNFEDGVELISVLTSLKKCRETDNPATAQYAKMYKQTVDDLVENINIRLREIDSCIRDTECYGAGIPILYALTRALQGGLNNHVSETELNFNCQEKLDWWKERQQQHEKDMDFSSDDAEVKLRDWCNRLDTLKSPGMLSRFVRWVAGADSSYDYELRQLANKIQSVFTKGKSSLQSGDFDELQSCINILNLAGKVVGKHITTAERSANTLRDQSINAFLVLCEQMQRILQENFSQFKTLFVEYRDFVSSVSVLHNQPETKKAFALVNQLTHEMLSNDIERLLSLTSMQENSFDFHAVKLQLEKVREVGSFVADHFLLLQEELKNAGQMWEEEWLKKLVSVSHEHFSNGRDFHLLKFYAALGVPLSASKKQIGQAYRKRAKNVHPDKKKKKQTDSKMEDVHDNSAAFRELKDAYDKLMESADSRIDCKMSFDDNLRRIGPLLRSKVSEFLNEQRYEAVERVLFNIPDFTEIGGLVDPPLNAGKIARDITDLVKNHVCKIRTEVDTNWSERRYRFLNDSLSDLKAMEMQFKAYPDVFPNSWNTGIAESIEGRIRELGTKAKGLLSSRKTAKENEDDFRSYFVEMGSVLVELPLFKDFTKRIMCDVLETCLKSDWGYGYLFELGLSLQRGDGDQTEEEMRVAHMVLAEFSHFKEVMTMAWNSETTQKPAGDTVHGIKGQNVASQSELKVDRETLLEHYRRFEAEYKKLLGEYLRPDAELRDLAAKTQLLCQKLQPVKCEGGWTRNTKGKLPLILAGVFAVFTILKSGESYNRIEESDEATQLGDKILMKPHNIQVLTLLQMFGCGDSGVHGLDSQLLQIRTGEGKSMILGAAAVLLGLLGFRVRCVCYSDYLSNRDYSLFKDVFHMFRLTEDDVKYSKISRLSEDTTAAKGDIRSLTEQLIRGACVCGSIEKIPLRIRSSMSSSSPAQIQNCNDHDASTSTTNVGGQQSEIAHRRHEGSISTRTRSSQSYQMQEHQDPPGRKHQRIGVTRPADLSRRHSVGTVRDGCFSKLGREEILLVDEVDVFFGADFYGQTYNQVAQLREPEVVDILKDIWKNYKKGGRRQRLSDVKHTSAYKQLIKKVPGFEYMVDNEIVLMLDQVRRVDAEPYVLGEDDKIGYKVMDSVSYNVTYGYSTVFAYLKESDLGKLKENDRTLHRELCMHVSCGQFSYANISPTRILGVSGTLEAMGPFERRVLRNYGIGKFLFMPSVYGKSNFSFEKAGDGIYIENGISDFYQRLCTEIMRIKQKKRAVIVFFRDSTSLKAFEDSPHYRKLGRQKAKLTEDMETTEKDYVIKRAATSGQLTISSAVFGRGTDFFCKDQRVVDAGGVHVIQTFLSAEKSEEIQIQGRTARQGKDGTYQMILLDSDLQSEFGLGQDFTDKTPKKDWYRKLCQVREKQYSKYCSEVTANLVEATERDKNTHAYFNSLLANDRAVAAARFKDIYFEMKKRPMPDQIDIDLALIIDVTGSMAPYVSAVRKAIKTLLCGQSSIVSKLKSKFEETKFVLNVGTMAYRDIDDKDRQFYENTSSRNCHFTNSMSMALRFIESATRHPSGGFDTAEDHLGAIHQCLKWNSNGDWKSTVKFAMVFTDSPAHGFVPKMACQVGDSYSVRHPLGITAETVVENLITKEVDLLFCSFNPLATEPTEQRLAELYRKHPQNSEEKVISVIPMIPRQNNTAAVSNIFGSHGQHIIFVLDDSGSMKHDWGGVVAAYRRYIERRLQNQSEADLVSVVQFDATARITVRMQTLRAAPTNLGYHGRGTRYGPAAQSALEVAIDCPRSHVPVIVFMSDGETHEADAQDAAQTFSGLNNETKRRTGKDLELHVIAFGAGLQRRQLQQIANSSSRGKMYTSADTAELSNIFVDIASSSKNLGDVLEEEIARRISDAVSDKVSMEYLG